MATGPRYSVPYKRKKENKTNYKKRLSLVQSDKPRLIARKSNKRIITQLTKFEEKGDKTLISISSNDLKNYGYKKQSKNIVSAYLTGYLLGKTALKNKINEAIFDLGLNIKTKGNKLFAVLKGALDAGMKIPYDEKILPNNDRLQGKHIKGFDEKLIQVVKKNIDDKVKL